MDDELFDWDDANIDHIAKHGVSANEAEEVILGDTLELDFGKSDGDEDRWSYVGETSRGRVLQVIITMRGEKIRVVTVFRPTACDEISYLEYRMKRQ